LTGERKGSTFICFAVQTHASLLSSRHAPNATYYYIKVQNIVCHACFRLIINCFIFELMFNFVNKSTLIFEKHKGFTSCLICTKLIVPNSFSFFLSEIVCSSVDFYTSARGNAYLFWILSVRAPALDVRFAHILI
jgi:hypothetical protein